MEEKDYCTKSPDTIFGIDFSSECYDHDRAYWIGGNANDRKQADINFRKAINKKIPGVGWIYYFAVRLFAGSHFGWIEENAVYE